MIKVTEESYDWLLNIKNIKPNYIRNYIDHYIEELFNISIDLTEDNVEFNLDSAELFGSIRNILDSGDNYRTVKVFDDISTLFNKRYKSIDCKYSHQVSLIGDLENADYRFAVYIPDNNLLNNYISDQDLINLYNENDEILLSLLSNKGGGSNVRI